MLLFFLLLLLLFSSCSKNEDYTPADALLCYGDTESKDPLRIFMDIQTVGFGNAFDYEHNEQIMKEFLSAIRQNIGEQDVVVEFLPNDSLAEVSGDLITARATTVSRMRVEILAGGGPDVFIMRYNKMKTAQAR